MVAFAKGVDSNVYIPADGRLQSTEISLAYALGHDVIEQGAGSGVTSRFYLYDGHGSTRALLNFAATVLQRYAYDAYGNQLTFGNLTSAANASTRQLFSGERSDKATGLQYVRARYVDPITGRFLSLDPADGYGDDPQTLHKYTFVHGDPVNFVDPSGLAGFSVSQTLGSFAVQTVMFTMRHPTLAVAVGFAINVVLPEDFHNAMQASGIPPFQFAGGAGKAGKYFLRTIAAFKNPLFTKLIHKWNQSASGLMAHEVGETFQNFFKQFMPGAQERVITAGKRSVDYVWRGFALEMKSGKGLDVPQLDASAQHAKDRGLSLVYFFLKKPSQADIDKVQNAGGHIVWFFDFESK